jgi:hypothetical protein
MSFRENAFCIIHGDASVRRRNKYIKLVNCPKIDDMSKMLQALAGIVAKNGPIVITNMVGYDEGQRKSLTDTIIAQKHLMVLGIRIDGEEDYGIIYTLMPDEYPLGAKFPKSDFVVGTTTFTSGYSEESEETSARMPKVKQWRLSLAGAALSFLFVAFVALSQRR